MRWSRKNDHDSENADHADQGPQHLLVGACRASPPEVGVALGQVQPVDHHQAQPVQQRHHRQQQRVGVRREASDGQVRAAEQGQEGDGVAGQVPAQPLLLVGLDDEQRHGGDHGGEPQQEQFGIAPVGQRRQDGDRRLGLRRHDTVRQVLPGSGWGRQGGGGRRRCRWSGTVEGCLRGRTGERSARSVPAAHRRQSESVRRR